MTRKEQIKEVAQKEMSKYPNFCITAPAFRMGAEWADAHPHWISVKDKLPKDGDYVLICNNRGLMTTSLYEGKEWVISETYLAVNVTHWMPLPQSPTLSNSSNTGKNHLIDANNMIEGGEE